MGGGKPRQRCPYTATYAFFAAEGHHQNDR
jgi:hypothetical protein